MNSSAVLLILASGITLTVGDIVIKGWVEDGKTALYALGLAIYFIGLIFLAQSYKYENIAEASMAVVLGNVITLAIFSWLYWGDKLGYLDILGMALGIAAFVILELRPR